MIFKSDDHKTFFESWINRTHSEGDPERTAMFYLLALDDTTRSHISEIYDFEERCIKPDGVFLRPWVTSSSSSTIRLAYSLYNSGICTDTDDDGEQLPETAARYTAANIFSSYYAPYYIQALQIRYPEYYKEMKP